MTIQWSFGTANRFASDRVKVDRQGKTKSPWPVFTVLYCPKLPLFHSMPSPNYTDVQCYIIIHDDITSLNISLSVPILFSTDIIFPKTASKSDPRSRIFV